MLVFLKYRSVFARGISRGVVLEIAAIDFNAGLVVLEIAAIDFNAGFLENRSETNRHKEKKS